MRAVRGRCRQHSAGFTLLELLIAITIVAALLAVTAPSSIRLYDNMQYRGAVREVIGLLNGTRIAAITQGAQQDVLIHPESREVRGAGGKPRRFAASVKLDVLSAKELNKGNAGVIRFYPDGSSSGGVVGLKNNNGRQTEIQVDWLLGKVEVCQDDCGSFR